MPSVSSVHRSRSNVDGVVRRYHRLERLASWTAAALLAGVVVASVLALPLLPGLLAAVAVVALARFPIVERRTTARLVSEADPATVEADFEGTTPPVLAFLWGIADDVRDTDEGAVYETSYLFGLRSVTMETAVRSRAPSRTDSVASLEVVVTADGRPWGTYEITVSERDSKTIVDVDSTSGRRFGLLRIPQGLVAERYYSDALGAQGYAVSERDRSLSV